MKKNIRLVICDIDSTLVTTERELTPRTRDVIHQMHAQGIYFGIASGRPLDELAKKQSCGASTMLLIFSSV